ncbi:carbamoyltransferase family protein [Nocardia iowensis]|uniref:Carbamoyltransferase n=1 Tax=Nocardia iowensis TaxID=204891 RepID=A0ABX8RN30_NOCIO|nr:carbamoyltransferase C-terminal domain-containing protein [Nocardia iowensis]QXN90731.1 carbamoyltransferase [Nocardia iowensis]
MTKKTWVAGLNHGAHDSAAALLCDGVLVAATEQERFTRRKRAIDQPPVDALAWCLEHAGITLADLDAVALGSDLDVLGAWMGLSPEQRRAELPLDDPDRLFPTELFGSEQRPPVIPVRHHLAHAASCFWPSGFEEAAILVLDNRGEDSATTLAYGTRDGIQTLVSYPVEHSLGLFYRIATQYVGLYSKDGNAGKLMGLASYGKPRYPVALRHSADGPIWDGVPAATASGRELPPQRTQQLLSYFAEHAYPYAIGLSDDITAYVDFAASVQSAVEETILGLAAELRDRTGSRNICLAGGVALNCTANGRLAGSGLFDNVFVQPMAHDAGVGLGAAYEVARQIAADDFAPQRMTHALWGPEFSDDQIAAALAARGLDARRLDEDELVSQVARIVSAGGVAGWHQGRSEVGPRALGGRSLIGDPRRRETLVRLNQVKNREMWRPLAPSVLATSFDKYFTGTPNPFMIMAASVREEVRSQIPAVVHIDGSARPQVVDEADQPRYAALLRAFETETGIPVLVNTSYNTAGMPLVNRPEESIDVFMNTDLDALAIGSYLVTRR